MPHSDTADWPLSLIRSAAMGDLAQQLYVAHTKWMRIRPDWTALPHERRKLFRDMATEMLEKLGEMR